MRISKDDLLYIFECADDPDQSVHGGLDMDDVRNALIENELEIEGYERSRWIKFNPDDPNTYPPVGSYLYVKKDKDEDTGYPITIMDFDRRLTLCDKTFAENNKNLKYWRQAPEFPE